MWAGGALLLVLLKLDVSDARPYTLIQYALEYGENERIQNGLFLSVLVVIGVMAAALASISGFNKETIHGNAKWATRAKINAAGLFAATGILIGTYKGKYITVPGDTFIMVSAPTRSGKGVGIVVPNLLNFDGSVIVTDIKLENFELTSGFRSKHGQDVYLFNPAPHDYKTHRYNPLGYIDEDVFHRIDDIQKIANYLIPTPKTGDPMWSAEARDLFFGVTLYLLDVREYPITIGEVLRQLKTERDTAEYLTEMMDAYRDDLSSSCISSLSNFINKPPKERSGVKSTLTSALNLWSNPLIDAATSANDFDLRDLRKRKMTIYLGVTPDNLERLAPIINLFIQQFIDLNTRELPASYDKKGRVTKGNPDYKIQTLLLLDEFPALGRMAILEKAVGYMAGYLLRFVPIIQAPSQLRSIYGADVAETFIKNHPTRTVFRPETMKEAEEISSELGFKTVKKTSVSTPRGFGSGAGTKSRSEDKRQLLLPQEVKELPSTDELIFHSGIAPIYAQKIVYYEDKVFADRILPPMELPTLEVSDMGVRGTIDEIDLGFMKADSIPLPQDKNRSLTEDEINIAAEAFFNSMVVSGEAA
ncbi:MAG: type IV secretory system conjugative DNA transfer family protein [Flavobacteriales bacterium]|nr:type IV secretory system conjugative DNA transfer family protein [Flavobacteriales bacterium]